MRHETTIEHSTDWVEGHALDLDRRTALRFHPADEGSGIVFVRGDLAGEPVVACRPENLRAEARWAALAEADVWVHHTEHVLATMAGLRIDNAVIELDSDRVPVVDAGSCRGFVEAILRTGVRTQTAVSQVYRLRRPVFHEAPLPAPAGTDPAAAPEVSRVVAGFPDRELSVSYVFHVPVKPAMRLGLSEFRGGAHEFARTIGRARTYYLDLESRQVAESQGTRDHGYIVLADDSPQRLVDEVAAHKTVDLLGDLMVLGRRLVGRLFVFRSGHAFHREFAARLAAEDVLELAPDDLPGGAGGTPW